MAELHLKGNESILDLCCGDGGLTEQLSMLVPEGSVLGIDASAGMIQTAKKRSKGNLSFARMDINQMDFREEFDVVFSNAALHWIKGHALLLQNTLNALKPGGVILWNFAGEGNCSNFFEVVRQLMGGESYKQYFLNFEWPWFMPAKSEYEKIVRQAGFSESKVTEENADRFFSDADEMIRWIDQPSIVPFVGAIPDERKEQFRNAVVEAMLLKTMQPDGTCFETFRRIKVFAQK